MVHRARIRLPKRNVQVPGSTPLTSQNRLPKRKAQEPAIPAPNDRRRRRRSSPVSHNEENETETALNSLTSLTCTIYHTSLLHLRIEETNLRRLCREVEASFKEKFTSLADERKETMYEGQAVILYGIKRTNHDAESFLLQLFKETRKGSGQEEKYRKLVFRCLFSSCGSTGRSLRFFSNHKASLTNLPLFLFNGSSKAWSVLQPILEEKFSCVFSPVHFSAVHMEVFGGIWLFQNLKRTPESLSEQVRIEFTFPTQNTNKPHQSHYPSTPTSALINFSQWKKHLLRIEDKLCESVELKQSLMKLWEDAISFHACATNLDISRAIFLKLATNTCVISSKGRMKLRNKSSLDEILPILVHLTRILELR